MPSGLSPGWVPGRPGGPTDPWLRIRWGPERRQPRVLGAGKLPEGPPSPTLAFPASHFRGAVLPSWDPHVRPIGLRGDLREDMCCHLVEEMGMAMLPQRAHSLIQGFLLSWQRG